MHVLMLTVLLMALTLVLGVLLRFNSISQVLD